jgi:hypothetical protein
VSATGLALGAMSLVYAGWMRFLGRRAKAGALGRTAPGIRLPATKVCEHTWAAAQHVAAPRYTRLAVVFLAIAALTLILGLSGVSEGVILIVWVVLAAGIQVVTLATAGAEASKAASEVRCEHQQAPLARGRAAKAAKPAPSDEPYVPRGRSRPRGGRGKGGKRR